jgi:hypothetical protein
MSLTAECPTCARTGDVPDTYRGRRVRCRQCGTFFTVAPAAASSLSKNPTNGVQEPATAAELDAGAGFSGLAPGPLSPQSSGEAENSSDPPDSDEVIAVRVSRARKSALRLDSAVVMGADGRVPY